jgi:putative ABC transport system permease protein
LGLISSFALVRVLSDLLIGVQPLDPATLLGLALLMALAAALGCAIPARRAMRIDPMTAMRWE